MYLKYWFPADLEMSFSLSNFAILVGFTQGKKGSPVVQKVYTEKCCDNTNWEIWFLFVLSILQGYKHATCIKHALAFFLNRNM